MGPDRLQLQRHELKFQVTEAKAATVREFVRCYLDLDEYGVGKPNLSYPIHSLYLDSEDLRLHWSTINGDKNRFKLRLRYYDGEPGSPVFFEIKRRCNEAILKQRGGVRRDAVEWLLAGHLPEPRHLLSNQPKQLVALQRFSQLMLQIRARPQAHVAYVREAWISRGDNSVRVTLDRQVRVEHQPLPALTTAMLEPVQPFEPLVILELKFTGRYPLWFRELVQALGLTRTSAAKYCDGVTLIGEDRFYRRSAFQAAPVLASAPVVPAARAAARRRPVPALAQFAALKPS